MDRLAAAIALAALLPLAGCATPYGGSPGAWAYYDKDYAYGQKGYERPIIYASSTYGEAAHERGDGVRPNPPSSGQTYYYAQAVPDYAGEAARFAGQNNRCNCTRPQRKAAHDPSWTSTYYAIGP